MNKLQQAFIWLFAILYAATGFVSTYHAVSLFSIANVTFLAVVLACVFEIGQASVLFSILVSKANETHWVQWILMVLLTTVQVIGNVFSSYKYMIINSSDQLRYFTDPILFWVTDPNPAMQNIILSYMIGAILPVVALCLTGIVARFLNNREINNQEDPIILNKEEDIPSEIQEPITTRLKL